MDEIKAIVTTPRKRDDLEPLARETAARIGVPFEPRRERSYEKLREETGVSAIFVESHKGPFIQTSKGPLFFHEGTAGMRTKNPEAGSSLAGALGLEAGFRILDATLGLATDALTAACFAPGGSVTGVESSPLLADIVRRGLKDYTFSSGRLSEAAGRIEVVCAGHDAFLRGCADGAYDVVYFDPMFERTVETSSSMQRLRQVADHSPVSEETLAEAVRVAARRVVVKARRGCFGSVTFSEVRPSGKSVIYGIIEK